MNTVMYFLGYLLILAVGLPFFIAMFAPIAAMMSLFGAPFFFFGIKNAKPRHIEGGVPVLVADDDYVSVAPLLTALAQYNVDVDLVSSGHDAVEKLECKSYTLVFLDYSMPDLNGMQVLEECDGHITGQERIPVVFYTGLPKSLSKKQLKHFEVRAVWNKELPFKAFNERLDQVMALTEAA